jgi:hypothetical protein
MEIENKWETIDKEPEVGDLVIYKWHLELPLPELGLVLQTYDAGMIGDELETAYVMWSVDDGESELFADLSVVSSGSVIYDS